MARYLRQVGLPLEEEGLGVIISSDKLPVLFNDDLPPGVFPEVVTSFARRPSKKADLSLRGIFKGTAYDNYGSSGYSGDHKVLVHMYGVGASIDVVQRRQSLIQRFSGDSEENDDFFRLFSLYTTIKKKLDSFNPAYNRDERIQDVAHPFYHFVGLLDAFRKGRRSDPLLSSFAERVTEAVEKHPIFSLAPAFEQERGRVIFERGQKTSFGFVSLDGASGINLGQYAVRDIDLSRFAREAGEIHRAITEIAPVMYTMNLFYKLGRSFTHLKGRGVPVCFPEFTDDGSFSVVNALPVATRTRNHEPKVFSFAYERLCNKVLFSGPHSGGKTAFLRNIGVIHATGLSGFYVLADSARIPTVADIKTSFRKEAATGKGSLESEVRETVSVQRGLKDTDLVLWDEFLDTTKPELASRLEVPLLRGFSKSPAAVLLVSHRAGTLDDTSGFRIVHPELEEVVLATQDLADFDRWGEQWRDPSQLDADTPTVSVLMPTRRMVEGKPAPELTARHAREMWNRVKTKVEYEKRKGYLEF